MAVPAACSVWPCRRSSSPSPSAIASASPSRAASTRPSPSPGCASAAPIPYAYTADLGPVRRGRHRLHPRPRAGLRRRAGPARRLQAGARPRGPRRPAVRRVPHRARPAARYFNTTPLGRAVTGTMLVQAMREDGVSIWGDGSTYKGNDIERFYRYGLLANPMLRIYKPWLDPDFVEELGGRHEMSEWLARARPAVPRLDREGVLHRRQHLGRDARGEEARARWTSRWIWSSRSWACGSGTTPSRSRPRRSCVAFAEGWPVAINGQRLRRPRRRWCARRTPIGGRHGLGMSDQIENRIIEAKSRGIYEAPGMALLQIAYERLAQRDPQRGHARLVPRGGPPARPAAVRGPLVRPAGADAARVAAALGRPCRHRRGARCACAAARTTPCSRPPART